MRFFFNLFLFLFLFLCFRVEFFFFFDSFSLSFSPSFSPPLPFLLFFFTMQDLVLDEKIRDWAVIPVALVMLLVGVWRHYLSLYLDSSASASLHDVCEGFVVVVVFLFFFLFFFFFFFFLSFPFLFFLFLFFHQKS